MKKIILGAAIALITLFIGGCSNGAEIKDSMKNVHPKCLKLIDGIKSDESYNNNQIMLVAIIVSNCDTRETILDEIKKNSKD